MVYYCLEKDTRVYVYTSVCNITVITVLPYSSRALSFVYYVVLLFPRARFPCHSCAHERVGAICMISAQKVKKNDARMLRGGGGYNTYPVAARNW